jgi:hypothetical protein
MNHGFEMGISGSAGIKLERDTCDGKRLGRKRVIVMIDDDLSFEMDIRSCSPVYQQQSLHPMSQLYRLKYLMDPFLVLNTQYHRSKVLPWSLWGRKVLSAILAR